MTDEATPTPDAGRDRHRVAERGDRVPARERRHHHERGDHRRGEPVEPRALRHAVPEHDVEREEARVGEREGEAERLAREPHAGEQVDADDGQRERGRVAPRPRAERGQRDDRQELDRGDRAERQPVDREVEAAVHHREHGAEREQQSARAAAPTAAARRTARRAAAAIRSQAVPERPDAHEEQHRERRPEVVEHGAADEPRVRRQAIGERAARRHGRTPSRQRPTRYSGDRRQHGHELSDPQLDATNRQLIAALQEDARLSLAELGRRVGLTAPAVGERLARLEEAGVIRGYHADVDPRALGYGLDVILRIRPAPRMIHKVAELAQDTPEVTECHRVTGEDCFVMRLHVRDVGHLEELIDRFVLYGQTTTSIVQSSPVAGRGVA